MRTRRFHPATSADTLVAELLRRPRCHPRPGPRRRAVLLIDDFDDLHPAEPWLREVFLPALPLGTVVVLAGRTPPALEWTTDPGWQELLSVHELDDLSPAEAGLLLDRRSVPRDKHASLLAITDGNPLALSSPSTRCRPAGPTTTCGSPSRMSSCSVSSGRCPRPRTARP